MVINPIVFNENGRGNDVFSASLERRVIYVIGEINQEMAATVVAQLLHLAAQSNDDIEMYINSPGGSVSAGLAIYDTMQFIRPDVATVCIGQAASMAAVLLSGGTKGKRLILPHAEVMIHQPIGGTEGQASDILIAAKHIEEIREELNTILASHCGKPYEEVARDTERDFWMKPAQAVAYGVADRVAEGMESSEH